jgi:hypothetical protein
VLSGVLRLFLQSFVDTKSTCRQGSFCMGFTVTECVYLRCSSFVQSFLFSWLVTSITSGHSLRHLAYSLNLTVVTFLLWVQVRLCLQVKITSLANNCGSCFLSIHLVMILLRTSIIPLMIISYVYTWDR